MTKCKSCDDWGADWSVPGYGWACYDCYAELARGKIPPATRITDRHSNVPFGTRLSFMNRPNVKDQGSVAFVNEMFLCTYDERGRVLLL